MITLQYALYYVLAALGLSKSLRHEVVEKVIGVALLFEKMGDFLKQGLLEKLLPQAKGPIISLGVLQSAFENTFKGLNDGFQTAASGLQRHVSSISQKIEDDDTLRPWRMFGYIFQLAFLAAFAYADTIQIINNLALIFPQDVPNVPIWMQNLTVSLLMSSVGVAVAAGFILAEFGEVTHFGKWNELKGGFRLTVQVLVWFSLISVLIIDALLAISRIKAIPDVAQMLLPDTIRQITLMASVASSLVIIPMIIITAMFLQGFVGFAILYMIVIWLLSIVLQAVQLVIIGMVWTFTYGIAYLIGFLFRIIVWVLVALLFMLGWAFAGTGMTLEKILMVAQVILDILYLWFL